MIWRVRRVLTGHDAEDKRPSSPMASRPNVKEMASMPGLALTDLWETSAAPASNAATRMPPRGRCGSSRRRTARSSHRRVPARLAVARPR